MEKKSFQLFIIALFSCQFDVTSPAQVTKLSKTLSLSDPDVATLAIDIADPKAEKLNSLMKCAAYANSKSQDPVRENKCSAFKFENGNCTLAKTPPFIDKLANKKPLSKGDEGYYVSLDKPLSEVVHSDLVVYVLINEEEYFNAHKNLPNGPRRRDYDGVTKKFDFNKESPVKTKEGYLAGTPLDEANLYMNLGTPQNLTEISVCVWYNVGDSMPSVTEILHLVRDFSSGSDPYDILALKFDGPTGKFIYEFRHLAAGDTDIQERESNSATLVPNTWYYVTSTYNIGTGEAKIYLDGNEIFNPVGSSHPGNFTFHTLRIGYLGAFRLTGYIASFEVYDKVLNQQEILDAKEKSTTYRVGLDL